MIPVYGFMENDTLGLLIFTYEDETVAEVAKKVLHSARCRVKQSDPDKLVVYIDGRKIEPNLTMRDLLIKPLTKLDVRKSRLEVLDG